MGIKVLAVDLNRCTGCRSSELRCAFKHHHQFNPANSVDLKAAGIEPSRRIGHFGSPSKELRGLALKKCERALHLPLDQK